MTCDHRAPMTSLDEHFMQCSRCFALMRKRVPRRTDPYSPEELLRLRMTLHSFIHADPERLWEIIGRLIATIDNHETVPGFIP